MRLIGNKTHGDLAEIGMVEFINQFMYDFRSNHVGKDLFRAKEREEDIVIINELTNAEFPVSLKAYGDGPLQLSTDSEQKMFPSISIYNESIENFEEIKSILNEQLPELIDEDIRRIVLENQDREMTDEEFLSLFIESLGADIENEKLSLIILHYRKESISNKVLIQIIIDARKISEIDKNQKRGLENAVKSAKLVVKLRKDEINSNKNRIKDINNYIQPIIAAKGKDIKDKNEINDIFNSLAFANFGEINVMPLIYKEDDKQCNIMVFDHAKAKKDTSRIIYVGKNKSLINRRGKLLTAKTVNIQFLCFLIQKIIIFVKLDMEEHLLMLCKEDYGHIQRTP